MKKFLLLLCTAFLIASSGLNIAALELVNNNGLQKTMLSLSGTVVSVAPQTSGNEDDGGLISYKVQIEDNESVICTFVINEGSYNAAGTAPDTIKPGDSFTGWYDPMAATIMIYPPQYHAVVYAVNMKNGIAAVDIFNFQPDGNMISRGGDLVLNMDANTNADGTPVYGSEIDGRLLVVYSNIIMESFPAQTVPDKIVALDYEPYAMEAAGWESGFYVDGKIIEAPIGYSVDGVEIETPMYYGNEQSDMMVPLRSVAEAMGYTVHWEAEMNAVILDHNVTINIGSKEYSVARMAPISLNSPAEIIDGRTYVPHTFFTEVLNAHVEITESGEMWRVDIATTKD